MNESTTYSRAALIVTNPQALRLGSLPRHHFGPEGGFIGACDADWPLDDGRQGVTVRHCQIVWDDGAFCLVDRSGRTRINDSQDALGQNVSVRLSQGDHIHIGPFRIAVHLEQEHHSLPDPDRHLAEHSLEELLYAERDAPAVQDEAGLHDSAWDASRSVQPADALTAFMRPPEQTSLDPLFALEMAQAEQALARRPASEPMRPPQSGSIPAGSPLKASPESRPRSTNGDDRMSSHHSFSRSHFDASPGSSANEELPSIAPLLEGLGLPARDAACVSNNQLMYESGQAIRAFVEGLLALRGTANAGNNLRLQSRTLQPIEDNPLHLGQSYQETVHALFSNERSRVHLSPKAAIEESLDELNRHQHAVQQGIEAGLSVLLQAFAPEQLMQRFQRYQSACSTESEPGDWAWQMYTHYYNELKSDRQRGFARLFWEVFEQHFDRAMRAEA